MEAGILPGVCRCADFDTHMCSYIDIGNSLLQLQYMGSTILHET